MRPKNTSPVGLRQAIADQERAERPLQEQFDRLGIPPGGWYTAAQVLIAALDAGADVIVDAQQLAHGLDQCGRPGEARQIELEGGDWLLRGDGRYGRP